MRQALWIGIVMAAALALGMSAGQAAEDAKAKVELPEAAAAAVKAAFPNAKIDEVEVEEECGVKVFEVELEEGKAEMEVEVTADGCILSVETEVELKDVPAPAAKAIQAAAEGATIGEIEKEEIRAEIKKGENGAAPKIVKLDAAKVVYEAKLTKGDQVGEIEVAADGTVIQPVKWKAKGAKADDDDDDDDDDDK
jgi:uncharacterized membrane protein YkoI